MADMAKRASGRWPRSLVTFSEKEITKLIREAEAKSLALATYVRLLVATHPERARGAGNR